MQNILNAYRTIKRFRDKTYSLMVARSFYEFGSRTVICVPFRIEGEGRIGVGSRVYIGANSWLQAIGPASVSNDPIITIGNGTSISGNCTISGVSRISIGSNVLIAQSVYIGDHSHNYENVTIPIKHQGVARVSPVQVCDGAWIGFGVVILPGVRIGINAVVGANSTVKYDVPDHCTAVGSPAKIVRVRGAKG